MTNRKTKIIKKAIATHFTKHVALEKLVLEEIAELEMLRNLKSDSRSRKKSELNFVENIGDVEIFSMLEAETNFNKAPEIYGEDRTRYAKSLLRPLHEAVKHPYLSQFPFFEFKLRVSRILCKRRLITAEASSPQTE